MLSAADYDIAEQFECRRIVDVELVRLCTHRATTEERARILRLPMTAKPFLTDPVGFRLLDYEYHQALTLGPTMLCSRPWP
jgi:DNA-binding FadR family transcriptional regulator